MAEASTLDCPVCSEIFNKPKLLFCNHVVCHKCVVNWLREAGPSGGCPLCRAPILSPSSAHQDDLETLVDALPAELIITAKVESNKILNSHHVCMSCENMASISFCLQCNMKLCNTCARGHTKFPAMRSHVIEELSKITPQRLAEVNRSKCKSHADRLAEHYCSAHQELICLLCSSTTHRFCSEVKTIKEAATEKREEFRREAQRLRENGMAMGTQIKEAKNNFAAMRTKANDIFDDLQRSLERQCQLVHDLIQAEEDQERAASMLQAGGVDSQEESPPVASVLDMEMVMRSRLRDLGQQTGSTDSINGLLDGLFDSQKVAQLKSDIETLGEIGQQPPAVLETTPTGSSEDMPSEASESASTVAGRKRKWAEMARVVQVGDRVKRGPDWSPLRGNEDGGGQGTVTAVPSQIASSRGADPTGCVDVKWDTGREDWYYLGCENRYELDMV